MIFRLYIYIYILYCKYIYIYTYNFKNEGDSPTRMVQMVWSSFPLGTLLKPSLSFMDFYLNLERMCFRTVWPSNGDIQRDIIWKIAEYH